MAGKKKEIQLQTTVCNQNEWDEMLLTKGVVVIDVYQAWCGPCKAVVNLFRKLKNDFSEDDVLHFAVAEANSIESLQPFRNKCEPVFLFCVNGKIIAIVRGANAPLLSKKITELVQEEREILAGQKERPKVDELVFLEEKLSEQSIESVEETVPEEEVTYSVGIIKPDDVSEGRVEEIKRKIRDAGFGIAASEEKMLTEEQIREFYTKRREQPDFDDFVQFMMSGPCHILIITKKKATDAIPLWTELHETNESMPDETEAEEKDRLQGTEENKTISNICDVPDSFEDASRQLAFFFPNFDRKNTEQKFEKTLALIRPCVLRERRNSIMQSIKDDGFEVAMQKEITLSEEQAREFYKEHENEDYFPALLEQMTSGPTLVLALTRQNAIQHWRDLLGPKTIEEAKKVPNSLRAKYAIDNIAINQLHGSSSVNDAQKELEFFFPQEHTLALIKPDAAKNHKDEIMQKVKDAGFTISKVKEEALTREMATQFYKDHEGKPFFEELVSCMTEGPSVIMVLTKENAVQEWRKLMGPTDPEVAKESCPESIRAQFAQNILSNAVHGSSNREHALESIEYVFGEIDID
ncbi:thioredoxin domain-containing protein 3 isoform X1 [Gallus gallus]|uniref:NME/NM23 family member 8 n=1 Tax=Gallus gallus TaxID=9031 RepID=A0A1D5PUV4_CHICK|nr:thioredoxin domain-containing protein 3 isoform X1 [Gallus gallus]XP_040520621.1 thioredoxin domain-containing protein 3 isoform X1 [Gallus gallus]XP_040520622.1 thioredoxin domain-containing protein 3 isoform X1 [Gallus gallus]XP_040520623.1 thioredoxin domain-containing protein 3 isoform X1 [Gallus gallus]XP_040551753.1 thioredoxin domain-containing protein 3 isoform X1 [Gallus gallus]XP_040551754.1 thioredoxin domain-containing protein 3 isoform X1 [Gallus gallus]XP_040551755.1 thioredo|eukprot:XP_426021.3 thioredoxin domain-containing protein 3 [Gallus gallus]